jgi:diguanylate cyclase (GGDEF)-like protein
MAAGSAERSDAVSTDGTRGRVLSVDDDLLSARGAARVLERSGYSVDVASSTDDALALMAVSNYDAIVTDLAMPGADGAEFITRGRALYPAATFIVVTGCDDVSGHLRRVPADSVLAVLRKPWTPNDLVDLVGRAMEVRKARSRLPGRARRLLLVEDSSPNADLIAAYLEEGCADIEITHVPLLADAVQLLRSATFDFVLTDLNLPDARGLDSVRRLTEYAKGAAIVAMSESVDPIIGAQSLELGASDYLQKDDLGPASLRRSLEHAALRMRAQRHLEELAFRDSLTGLSNARHLRDRLTLAVARAARLRAACALIFIDLDGFKPVNDQYGHEAGDHVLQVVSRRMDKELRSSDTLARLGGDEFAILLEDVDAEAMIASITERLLAAIAEPIPWKGGLCQVSGSAGIALCPESGDSPEAVLRAADASMYEAKAKGPGRYSVAKGAVSCPKVERAQAHDALREAVRRNEFALAFQPQITGKGRRVIGMEALLRWRRDRREEKSPSEFIPLLEQTELVHSVGLWVVESACRQFSYWNGNGRTLERISVNASPRQFERPDFASEVLRRLEMHGLESQQLELEVTEGLLLKETPAVTTNLTLLHRAGVRLAVDDFGTGFGSFGYLRRFHVDLIKIDRSFIKPLGDDPQSERLVAGMIEFAHKLGIEVAAEGVETFAQLMVLRRLGCDIFQGYLCGRPIYGTTATGTAPAVGSPLRSGLVRASMSGEAPRPSSVAPPPAMGSGSPQRPSTPPLAATAPTIEDRRSSVLVAASAAIAGADDLALSVAKKGAQMSARKTSARPTTRTLTMLPPAPADHPQGGRTRR